jgi:hypothetical protein
VRYAESHFIGSLLPSENIAHMSAIGLLRQVLDDRPELLLKHALIAKKSLKRPSQTLEPNSVRKNVSENTIETNYRFLNVKLVERNSTIVQQRENLPVFAL